MRDPYFSSGDGPFCGQGLASLDDLETPEWEELFGSLEVLQREFLDAKPHTASYRWVKDALHTSIRVWEYPFVFYQLRQCLVRHGDNCRSVVADLGSGATFFPFAVARLGADVVAVDSDGESGRSLSVAMGRLSLGPGNLRFVQGDIRALPLESGTVDCAYCISVLEHLPKPQETIEEVARVLKPNGVLVLTFDVDLRGNSAIGSEDYRRLRQAVDVYFQSDLSERFVHPLRVLTTDNSPYPYYSGRRRLLEVVRSASKQLFEGKRTDGRILASTYGLCLRKREKS